MLLTLSLVLSVLIGLLRRGRIQALGEHTWHRLLLPLIAFGLQVLAFLPDENATSAARLFAAALHITSYILLLTFVWVNRTAPFMWLTGLGLAANATVVAVNGGFMPVPADAYLGAASVYYNNATVLSHGQRLLLLADIFRTPAWIGLHQAFSVGDLMVTIGVFIVVQRLMTARQTAVSGGET